MFRWTGGSTTSDPKMVSIDVWLKQQTPKKVWVF
jgi:hypothetical protein